MNRTKLEAAIFFSGKTSTQIAKEVGVTPSHFCRIAKGKFKPRLDLALRIARALGKDAAEVFNL